MCYLGSLPIFSLLCDTAKIKKPPVWDYSEHPIPLCRPLISFSVIFPVPCLEPSPTKPLRENSLEEVVDTSFLFQVENIKR